MWHNSFIKCDDSHLKQSDNENCDFSDFSVAENSIGEIKDFNSNITSNALVKDKGCVKDAFSFKHELRALFYKKSKCRGNGVQASCEFNTKTSKLTPLHSHAKVLVKWYSEVEEEQIDFSRPHKKSASDSKFEPSTKILQKLQEEIERKRAKQHGVVICIKD